MSNRYVASIGLPPHNHYSLGDNYDLRQSTTSVPSQKHVLAFKVCETDRNQKNCMFMEVWSSNTIKELKEKIAYYSRIDLPLNKFFLEIFDENERQWKEIDDSNSSVTIHQLKLRPGSLLNVVSRYQQVPNDRRPPYSTSASNNNHELILKLCKRPMDKTDYVYLRINSFSTLEKLRKQAYEQFNKSSKNQPIYLWIKDGWMQFAFDMDDQTLDDLFIESHAYISIDYDEENFGSKLPSGLCGLANLGSTCFMNSVFQCLSNIPEFTKRILALNGEVNAPIIDEYTKLIKNMWSGKYSAIDPSSLLDNINNHLPRYATYRQQDAQEFMNHFLHLIHAELSTKETLITDLFYGQIRSTVKCLGCQQSEITNESISFLPLPISNYHQKTVLYIKTDGEQRLVSLQVNSSVITVGDLIDCFLRQHELTLTRERIQAVQLVNNVPKKEYETRQSLSSIREVELAFLECPAKLRDRKYIFCEFFDYSTGKPFRPPTYLICPTRDCHYTHLSDQIDQILGHLYSITNAPPSACHLYWIDQKNYQYKLSVEASTNKKLPRLAAIAIEMTTEWVNIYKEHYNINHSTNNSTLASLLNDFFREEPLDGDYHCLKCPKLTKARQKSDLCLPLPHALIIQLKRFTYDIYSNDKINTYISFPLYGLDLNEYIVKDNSNKDGNSSTTKYDLVAVSNHTGSLTSGHYITYAKNIQDGNWYSFDDKIVRRLNGDNDIVTKNAYILIYVQKTDDKVR